MARLWWLGLAFIVAAPAAAETPLVRAARLDDLAGAEAALAAGAAVDAAGPFGATPLALAVNAQDSDLVALLLRHGANPNRPADDGTSPLALACELGNGKIVDQLLDARADVRRVGLDGATTLAVCARFGPEGAVARMLGMGATADQADSRGQTPLMWAASNGRLAAIAALIKAGAKLNRATAAGMTPLFFAIRSGKAEPVAALLAAGADATWRGPENTSALQFAFYQHNTAAAELLPITPAALVEPDRNGLQPLHAAAQAGDVALVERLLKLGANPNALTGASRITWVTEANFGVPPPPVPPLTPLLLAAAAGQAGAMRTLLAAGAKADFIAADGTNLVLAAARGHKVEALDVALAAMPDVNRADGGGTTALHVLAGGFAFPDLPAMLAVLRSHGARVDLADKHGATAVKMAANGVNGVRDAFVAIGWTFAQDAR